MHYVVFTTHREGVAAERLRLFDQFSAYLHDHPHHPNVTVHHAGPTLDESETNAIGLILVLEASSLDAARAFVADSPYAQADLFADTHIRPWNWLTGRPG